MSGHVCKGQVALVTGASKGGTGTAIALRLAAEGATVAVTARTLQGLKETQRRIRDPL
jgi:NAD(P)-dependent dehydrogenase (short-subunit alcohol dehydrogenase family)